MTNQLLCLESDLPVEIWCVDYNLNSVKTGHITLWPLTVTEFDSDVRNYI